MEQTTNIFQCSPQQAEQWKLEADGPTGRMQAIVRLTGPLEPPGLHAALRRVVDRHESLRTTFVHQAGVRVPFQAVNDELEPGWETTSGSESDLPAALSRQLEQPFDFENGPLVRGLLVREGADRHVLVLTASALCMDPASLSLLVVELSHQLGAEIEVEAEPLQYADFAAWQLEVAESGEPGAAAAGKVWATAPAGPQLPLARTSSASFVPEAIPVRIGASATAAFAHAAWYALLSRLSHEPQLVVPYLPAGRRHSDLAGAIGAIARPAPVAIDVDGASSFESLLEQLERARDEAVRMQDYAPGGAGAEAPVGFSEFDGYQGQAGELTICLERIVTTCRSWRLWLTCAPSDEPLTAWIYFDPACYEAASMVRLAHQLEQLTAHALTDPSTPVSALRLHDGAERARLLRQYNTTQTAIPTAPIHELFARHAATSPQRTAVLDEHSALSYGELETYANQLAHRLRSRGVGPGVTVGLCTDRSVDAVLGLLGILKAGGAYIPLNFEHPPARLEQQLTNAGARVILTQEALISRFEPWKGEVLCLDSPPERAAVAGEPVTAPDAHVEGNDLAYVIYTSGSTGAPKGVEVTHGNLSNYAVDMVRRLGADREPLSFGLVTSPSTDLGNTSIFGALASGGTLVLVSPAASADPAALSRRLELTPVDVLKITPSHMGALLAGGDGRVLPRRTLVIGGEPATWDLVDRVRGVSNCRILNHYGPTETTIGCCTFLVPEGPAQHRPDTVPIGGPIANTVCYVLDEQLEPAPLGVPGTLYVGGAGVARGYIGQPQLTAAAFAPDPFSEVPGDRVYNTGDIVRRLPGGALEFLGRADEQVKIRGYRVEPAEVESALRSHPAVTEAAVLAARSPGETRLVAYCTATGPVSEGDLHGHLASLLPEVMVPSAILRLEEMPRTPSGKIDRRSLPDPASISDSTGASYVAPRTPVEETIAAIWASTLGLERVSVEDDFFVLGGHSLLATQVVAQLRSELAVDLPLHSLFTAPTIESLAREVLELMRADDEDETAKLLSEIEGLSDEEAQRLLAAEGPEL